MGDQALFVVQLQEWDFLLKVVNIEIEVLEIEFKQLGQQFYIKIIKLCNYISQYGGFINLAWWVEEKVFVYCLFIEIFGDMGFIQDENMFYIGEGCVQINFVVVWFIYKEYKVSLQ